MRLSFSLNFQFDGVHKALPHSQQTGHVTHLPHTSSALMWDYSSCTRVALSRLCTAAVMAFFLFLLYVGMQMLTKMTN